MLWGKVLIFTVQKSRNFCRFLEYWQIQLNFRTRIVKSYTSKSRKSLRWKDLAKLNVSCVVVRSGIGIRNALSDDVFYGHPQRSNFWVRSTRFPLKRDKKRQFLILSSAVILIKNFLLVFRARTQQRQNTQKSASYCPTF